MRIKHFRKYSFINEQLQKKEKKIYFILLKRDEDQILFKNNYIFYQTEFYFERHKIYLYFSKNEMKQRILITISI